MITAPLICSNLQSMRAMPTIFATCFLAFLSLASSCGAGKDKHAAAYSASNADSIPYNFAEPSHTIFFATDELKEVSGLSPTDQPGIFCAVQDEKGILFFVDASGGGAVLERVPFKEKGDFEGVEIVGKTAYAVKSNGDVYELKNWKKDGSEPEVKIHDTPLDKTADVEGLGYDQRRRALLLACKGNPDSATLRNIYAFDLQSNTLSPQPVFQIDPAEVDRLLAAAESDGKSRWFAPSGIAIHPKTGDVYVLSSVKKRLVVLDYASGTIKHAVQLSKKILPQPEGIAFDPTGNLYLSSEGKNGEGLLLKFNMK